MALPFAEKVRTIKNSEKTTLKINGSHLLLIIEGLSVHIQVQIAKIGKRVVPDNHYINLGVELKSKYRKDHKCV